MHEMVVFAGEIAFRPLDLDDAGARVGELQEQAAQRRLAR